MAPHPFSKKEGGVRARATECSFALTCSRDEKGKSTSSPTVGLAQAKLRTASSQPSAHSAAPAQRS
eukprot:4760904-Pleurochrysis_carterae.AAC.1